MIEYLFKLRGYIKFSVRIFMLSLIVGAYIAIYHSVETQAVVNWAAEALSSGMELSRFELFLFIFRNNTTALFYSLIESVVFGISSIMMIVANGVIVGVFMILVTQKISFIYFILGIAPHGIFEIPAAIITASMGMRIGSTVIAKLTKKNVSIIKEIYDALKCYFMLIVPLLFVAALIEAFVTPVILSLVS